jgi:hypothetical protein
VNKNALVVVSAIVVRAHVNVPMVTPVLHANECLAQMTVADKAHVIHPQVYATVLVDSLETITVHACALKAMIH